MRKRRQKQIRDKGEGSVYQKADGAWVAQVFVCFRSDGRKKYKTKTEHSYQDAVEAKKKMLADVVYSRLSTTEDVRFVEFVKHWLDFKKADDGIKDKTYAAYENIVKNHFVPAFGRYKVAEIKTVHVNQFLINKQKEGMKPSGVVKIRRVLNNIYELAADEEIVQNNPVSKCLKISLKYKEPVVITDEDLKLILSKAQEISSAANKYNTVARTLYGIILTAYMMGLRISEVLALRWSNIDIENSRISIVEAVKECKDKHTGKYGLKIEEPKRGSKRNLSCPQVLLEELQRLKDTESDIVFLGRKQSYIYPSNFERAWRRLMDSVGLTGKYTVHALRRTHATELIGHNFDIKTVQGRMGHKDPRVLLAYYAAQVEDNDKSVADYFDTKQKPVYDAEKIK